MYTTHTDSTYTKNGSSVVQRVGPRRHLSLGLGKILQPPAPTRHPPPLPLPLLLALAGGGEAEALAAAAPRRRRRLDAVPRDHHHLCAWNPPAMAVACCYDEHKREQQEHEPGALRQPHGGSAFPPAIERRVKRRCEEHAEEEDLEMAAAE